MGICGQYWQKSVFWYIKAASANILNNNIYWNKRQALNIWGFQEILSVLQQEHYNLWNCVLNILSTTLLLHTSKNKVLILPVSKVSSKTAKIDIEYGTINPYFRAFKRLLTHICEVGYYPHFVQEKITQGYITCAATVANREQDFN